MRRLIATLGVGLALGLAGLGVYAYKFFTDRPGEDALRLIPNTALVVVTLDLSPSVSQTGVFKKIDDALDRNGYGKELEKGMGSLFSSLEIDEKLSDYIQRSGVFSVIETDQKKGEHGALAFLVGIKDPVEVDKLISKVGSSFSLGKWKGYALDKSESYVAVIGSYVVFSNEKDALRQIARTERLQTPSILSNAEFSQARQKLDADSNLMAFIHPKSFESSTGRSEKVEKLMSSVGWVAVGLSLRDGGLAMKYSADVDPSKYEPFQKLVNMKPLRADLYNVLPSGAYCVMAGSQLSTGIEMTVDMMKEMEPSVDLSTIDREIRKEIGMGIRDGILPALQGNMVVAAYPSKAPTTGADLLILVDDQNGADPAKLVDAVRRTFSTKYIASTRKGPFMDAQKGDGSAWHLSPGPEQELRDAMSKNMSSKEFDASSLADNKTVAYVKFGNTVAIATSDDLLRRATAAYQAHSDSLSSDGPIAGAASETLPQAQGVAIIHISRIAECIEQMLNFDKMEPEGAKMAHGFVDLFKSLKAPMHASSSVANNTIRGAMFVPLDYDRVIDFISGFIKDMDKAMKESVSDAVKAPSK